MVSEDVAEAGAAGEVAEVDVLAHQGLPKVTMYRQVQIRRHILLPPLPMCRTRPRHTQAYIKAPTAGPEAEGVELIGRDGHEEVVQLLRFPIWRHGEVLEGA